MDTSTELQPLIDKVKKKSTFLKWGIGLAGVLLLAPLVWALAYAVLGVAALGASLALAGAVGVAIIYFTPVFMMKMENAKINAIVAEATKNPIPTMWGEWQNDGLENEQFRQSIVDFDAAVESSFEQIKALKKDMTDDDFANFEREYNLQKEDVAAQYADLAELTTAHKAAEIEIKRLSAIWEGANAQSKASAMNMATRRMDAISAIKRDTAFKAVVAARAHAKAQMRSRIEHRKTVGVAQAAAALSHAQIDGEVITAGGMPVKFAAPEAVKVGK